MAVLLFLLCSNRQMTKLTEFKLKLNTNQKIFRSGDQIPCKVILTLDRLMKTKGIAVISKGK